jgi:hypothetical protein
MLRSVLTRTCLLLGALPLGALPAAALQGGSGLGTLWIVDDGGRPGSQFQDLPEAFAAASDGDAILLRSGTYQTADVELKAVSIFAEPGAVLQLNGDGLEFEDTPVGTPLVLSGLGQVGAVEGPWHFDEIRGPLILQDCRVKSSPTGPLQSKSKPAVTLEDVPNTFIDNSRLTGGAGFDWGGATTLGSSAALELLGGRLFVYRSQLVGGQGAHGSTINDVIVQAGDGADGLVLNGGRTYLIGSTLQGGSGGDANLDPSSQCGDGGDGGPALHLANDNPWARLDSVVTFAGQGGQAKSGCQPGQQGVVLEYDSGTFGILSPLAPPPSFDVPSVAREFEPLPIEFRGEPGELVFWLTTAKPVPTEVGGWGGLLLDSQNGNVTTMGVVPANGKLSAQVSAPDLLMPGQCAFAFQQAAFLNASSGLVRLSSARVTLLVDQTQ